MNTVLPGPGHYTKPLNADLNEWHKKTFNYRYLKQFHHLGEHSLSTSSDALVIPRARTQLNSIS